MDIFDSKDLILTENNRRYLAGRLEDNKSTSTLENYDSRIRENVLLSIRDLAHLYRHGEDKHFTSFAEGWESRLDDPVSRWEVGPSIRYPSGEFGDEGSSWPGKKVPSDQDETISQTGVWLQEVKEREPDKATPETQEALIDAVAFICRAADTGKLKISEVLEKGANRHFQNRADPYAEQDDPTDLFEQVLWPQLQRQNEHRLGVDVELKLVRRDGE